MILPEPITIDGRDGVIVFLDKDRQPVEPSDPKAVVARAVFDDGGRATYSVGPKDAEPDEKPEPDDDLDLSRASAEDLAGHSARLMGISGYHLTDLFDDDPSERILRRLATSAGVETPRYHGFQNTHGIAFTPGDTFKIPLTPVALSLAASGWRPSPGAPTVFVFAAGTPVVESFVAGEFRVVSSRQEAPLTLVTVEAVRVYHPADGWRERG